MTGQSQAIENPELNSEQLSVEFPRLAGKPAWNLKALLKWPSRWGFDCGSDRLRRMPAIYALDDYRFGQCRKTAGGRKVQPLRQRRTFAATAALLRADAIGSGISVAARRSAFALDEPPWIALAPLSCLCQAVAVVQGAPYSLSFLLNLKVHSRCVRSLTSLVVKRRLAAPLAH